MPRPASFYRADRYFSEPSVGLLMKQVMLSIVAQVDLRLGVHGLTSAQWGPLLHLSKAGPSTVLELARWVLTAVLALRGTWFGELALPPWAALALALTAGASTLWLALRWRMRGDVPDRLAAP